MRRLLTVFGLECFAVALAILASLHGVITDEAKYLLNIPYPHPPLARFVMGLTAPIPGQEMFWRIALATLLVQSVWLVSAFLPRGDRDGRTVLSLLWLSSAAVVLSAGSILVAPVTAVEALLFLWLYLKGENLEDNAGWIALLWFASLFTAYQIVLFLPVVAVVFWKMKLPLWVRLSCLFGPLVALSLYTLASPLILATFVTAGTQNATGMSILETARRSAFLWVMGGSAVLSLLGTFGAVKSKSFVLVLSFLLVAAFVFLTYRSYYALLFTPLFIAGVASYPPLLKRSLLAGASAIVVSVFLIRSSPPEVAPSTARAAMRPLLEQGIDQGTLLIAGSFGHEWQYESPLPVERYVPDARHIDSARVVVCLADCPEMVKRPRWLPMTGVPVKMWVRKLR